MRTGAAACLLLRGGRRRRIQHYHGEQQRRQVERARRQRHPADRHTALQQRRADRLGRAGAEDERGRDRAPEQLRAAPPLQVEVQRAVEPAQGPGRQEERHALPRRPEYSKRGQRGEGPRRHHQQQRQALAPREPRDVGRGGPLPQHVAHRRRQRQRVLRRQAQQRWALVDARSPGLPDPIRAEPRAEDGHADVGRPRPAAQRRGALPQAHRPLGALLLGQQRPWRPHEGKIRLWEWGLWLAPGPVSAAAERQPRDICLRAHNHKSNARLTPRATTKRTCCCHTSVPRRERQALAPGRRRPAPRAALRLRAIVRGRVQLDAVRRASDPPFHFAHSED